MIPPRVIPPGTLQLYEVNADGERKLIQELPSSSKNRHKIHNIRNDMLMVNPTAQLIISENNALK